MDPTHYETIVSSLPQHGSLTPASLAGRIGITAKNIFNWAFSSTESMVLPMRRPMTLSSNTATPDPDIIKQAIRSVSQKRARMDSEEEEEDKNTEDESPFAQPNHSDMAIDRTTNNSMQTQFLTAIQSRDKNLLKAMLNVDSGVAINQIILGQKTALTTALETHDPEIISLLLEHGADPNLPDGRGNLPLTFLAFLSPLPTSSLDHALTITQLLLNKGALINKALPNCNSALTMACFKNRPALVHFLLAHGALLELPDGVGCNALEVAQHTRNPELTSILLSHKTGLEHAQSILNMRAASLIWTISGSVQETIGPTLVTVRLEGSFPEIASSLFKKYYDRFCSSRMQINTSQDLVKEAIDHMNPQWPLSIREIVQIIHTGHPFLMSTTCQTARGPHEIGLVIQGDRLLLSNRGPGLSPGITIYPLRLKQITEQFLKRLQETSDLFKLFSFIEDSCGEAIASIPQKAQKMCNCTWVSKETNLLALLYMQYSTKGHTHQESIALATRDYKKFTSFAREASLQDYIASCGSRTCRINEEFLNFILKKISSAKIDTPTVRPFMLAMEHHIQDRFDQETQVRLTKLITDAITQAQSECQL